MPKRLGANQNRRNRLMTKLVVHPHCLMFFVDETGHENMSDPKYPVFGFGGCAIPASAIEEHLRQPWRELKETHFGSADVALHASDLRNPTQAQLDALGAFFRKQRFGRFAVTMTSKVKLPDGVEPYRVIPNVLRKRWAELISRVQPIPPEVALIHEASQRGDSCWNATLGRPSSTLMA